jgi:hypothetical protein
MTEDLAPGGPEGDQLDPGLVAALKRYQARHNLRSPGFTVRSAGRDGQPPASTRPW